MARKNYGPISKAIKRLCVQLCLLNGSEAEFKDGLMKFIHTGASFDAMAKSLRKWALEICKDDPERAWRLADQVDMRIRKAWQKYQG